MEKLTKDRISRSGFKRRPGDDLHSPIKMTVQEREYAKQAAYRIGIDFGTFNASAILRAAREVLSGRKEGHSPAEVEVRVQEEIRKRLDEFVLPRLKEREQHATKVLKARKGVFSARDWNHLMKVLHPDTQPSEGDRQEAFVILNSQKVVLLAEKDLPTKGIPLPRTLAEMLARKKVKA